jgi:uncharacterized membrane protein
MMTQTFALRWLAAFILTPLLDFFWLGLLMKGFYRSQLGSLMRETPVWSSGFAVYVFIATGITLFACPPNETGLSPGAAGIRGAFLGAVIYGIFEFTNHALVSNWPIAVVFADLAWGVVLFAAVSFLSVLLVRG